MSKFRIMFGLMLFFTSLITISSCATQNELIRFSVDNNYLVLTKNHISGVTLESDAAGKKIANMQFSNKGQEKISEFTANHINEKLTISSNSNILMKDIKIRDKIDSKSIMFGFNSDSEAIKFVNSVVGDL